jgi:hypothetical protein
MHQPKIKTYLSSYNFWLRSPGCNPKWLDRSFLVEAMSLWQVRSECLGHFHSIVISSFQLENCHFLGPYVSCFVPVLALGRLQIRSIRFQSNQSFSGCDCTASCGNEMEGFQKKSVLDWLKAFYDITSRESSFPTRIWKQDPRNLRHSTAKPWNVFIKDAQ